MSYVPNPSDPTEPVASRTVESAAREFREIKGLLARSLSFPAADTPTNRGLLPPAADRAGRVLQFNATTGVPETGATVSSLMAAESNAAASAASAANSAASAAQITALYLGVQASDPATNLSGGALVQGNWYINSTTGFIRVRISGSWVEGISAGVNLTGDQSVGGVKTFTSQIVASGGVQGNVTGNAATVTNGVYTTGDQTIGGIKTFSSAPRFPNRVYLNGATTAYITNANDANWGLLYKPSQDGAVAAHGWLNNAGVAVAQLTGAGHLTVNGNITAGGQFLGNGAGLTNLPAAQLTGNVAAARITNALNASGSAPIYACRAWVNFNGTGTAAIRASGNVSSITDHGVGDYTVNFTNAMPDANYALVGSGADDGGGATPTVVWTRNQVTPPTTSSTRIGTRATNNAESDSAFVHVAIFR